MPNPYVLTGLLTVTALLALAFVKPQLFCVFAIVRFLRQQKRDAAAAKALREMGYYDDRRPKWSK